jgi:DNA-binding NtrC family response regulator
MADVAPLILTVDDDPHLIQLIQHHVTEWGYRHAGAETAEQMWDTLKDCAPSVALLDVALGNIDGTTLLPEIKQHCPNLPVIVITADATIATAVRSVKRGAYDFITKPLDFERLHIEIDKAVTQHRLSNQVEALQCATRRTDFHGMVGRSAPMTKAYRLIETVAPTEASVLILGETGTGKELTARAIHECSKRSDGPFVPVNAPAIPHELIESALFGHEKGAFTGAYQRHIGFCEQADSGTLFLDEICEMDYNVQAKLLRFLENHVIQRVGAKSSQTVDVRVIAATNRDPQKQIETGKLREDFFYRLGVVSIHLVPLRERDADIALLAKYFLNLNAARYGRNMTSISPRAMDILKAYPWPGNVRQLEHVIDQVVITNSETELIADMLPDEIAAATTKASIAPEKPTKDSISSLPSVDQVERDLILRALHLADNSVAKAAQQIGLSEATLYRKLKKYGITKDFRTTR